MKQSSIRRFLSPTKSSTATAAAGSAPACDADDTPAHARSGDHVTGLTSSGSSVTSLTVAERETTETEDWGDDDDDLADINFLLQDAAAVAPDAPVVKKRKL